MSKKANQNHMTGSSPNQYSGAKAPRRSPATQQIVTPKGHQPVKKGKFPAN